MQCTTNYPADYIEANIKVITKFKDYFIVMLAIQIIL